jgi:hypothetical protein
MWLNLGIAQSKDTTGRLKEERWVLNAHSVPFEFAEGPNIRFPKATHDSETRFFGVLRCYRMAIAISDSARVDQKRFESMARL